MIKDFRFAISDFRFYKFNLFQKYCRSTTSQ
jgi:hypothetical protein